MKVNICRTAGFVDSQLCGTSSYLCDGKVEANIDDDSEEEDVEGPYNQQRLLQHQDLVEVIVNLNTREEVYKCESEDLFIAHVILRCEGWTRFSCLATLFI